jgi:hypothetical protein
VRGRMHSAFLTALYRGFLVSSLLVQNKILVFHNFFCVVKIVQIKKNISDFQ